MPTAEDLPFVIELANANGLDGHSAPDSRVLRAIDNTHRSTSQFALYDVTPDFPLRGCFHRDHPIITR